VRAAGAGRVEQVVHEGLALGLVLAGREQFLEDDFADVLWVSAKQTDWVGAARYQTMMAEHSLSTDVVLDLLLMQLGLEPWTTQMPAQKQQVLPGCIGRSTLFDRPGQHRNPAG
jgi:hypothetical protein